MSRWVESKFSIGCKTLGEGLLSQEEAKEHVCVVFVAVEAQKHVKRHFGFGSTEAVELMKVRFCSNVDLVHNFVVLFLSAKQQDCLLGRSLTLQENLSKEYAITHYLRDATHRTLVLNIHQIAKFFVLKCYT